MDSIALVTGGVTGIGAATCLALKEAGHRVAATFLGNGDEAKAFSETSGIPVYEWSIGDFDACQEGVKRVEAEHGPVSVLVNNAGITRDAMLHKMSAEDWRTVIEVDLGGCFNMCKAVIEGMRERRYGRIVNVSSVNGLSGQAGQTNYSAAKAGVLGFTKALAQEVATRGITVNAVAPGYTETAMVHTVKQEILDTIVAGVPMRRFATPEEIAAGIAYLASEKAAFVTGETLSINGGKYMA